MKKNLIKLSLLAVLFSSCAKDPENAAPINESFENGVFIVNEGNFQTGNASIDFYSASSNKIYSDVFKTANNLSLGDVAQSMTVYKNRGYIIVNGSGKVEVINKLDAKSVATITGFSSPRYMIVLDSIRAFVSDWFSNTIKEINLNTNQIVRSINVGEGPEGMCLVGTKLYVANCGGFGLDSTISIVDISSNVEEKRIKVGDAPTSIQVDKNGHVWVLCKGSYGADWMVNTDDTKGALVEIDPISEQIIRTLVIGELGDHPEKLKINSSKNKLFYSGSLNNDNYGIYQFNINASSLPVSPFIAGTFYGYGYNKISNELFLASSPSFSQKGFMLRYDSTGTLIKSYDVGFIPNGISEQ